MTIFRRRDWLVVGVNLAACLLDLGLIYTKAVNGGPIVAVMSNWVALGVQWSMLTWFMTSMQHLGADEAQKCRIQAATGQPFVYFDEQTGTMVGTAESMHVRRYVVETVGVTAIAVVLTVEDCWQTALVAREGQSIDVSATDLQTVMAAWRTAPEAASAAALLLWAPGRLLWFESAEVVW